MSNSVSKKLAQVKQLINEFKYEEGLQVVKDIERTENLTPEEMLESQVYKGWLYHYSEQHDSISYSDQLKIVEDVYQKSQEMKMPLFSLDALCLKGFISLAFEGPKEFMKNIEQYEILFKSIPRADTLAFREKEAILIAFRGSKNWYLGRYNLALELHSKSLALLEQIDPKSHFIITVLWATALDYQNKGELKSALESAEKALSLIPEGEGVDKRDRTKAVIYEIMGRISYEQGNLIRALEYYKLSLEIWEKVNRFLWMYHDQFMILRIYLAQKNFDQARNYLQQFKKFNEMHKSEMHEPTIGPLFYQIAYALVLKSSPRMHDHTQAENILKKIIEGDESNISIIISALKNLCELYFEEFQQSNQMEVLDDIYPIVDRLRRIARQSHSYLLLALVKLLQAKLALIELNIGGARKLLTEAQIIADEHGLQLLAGMISREHDHLLEELKLWESFKKEQASVSERLKLASIDGVIERMQGKRAIEPPDVSPENPILLLIIAEGGIPAFSYPFSKEWSYEDGFISNFLSAFNTFSEEVFSKGLDRAVFGDYTLIMESIDSFSACYLFKGQTYGAKQKLSQLTERIQDTASIWQDFKNYHKTHKAIALNENFESLLNEIFV